MAEFLIKGWRLVQIVKRAVDFDTLKTLLAQLSKLFAVLAFAVTDDRSQEVGACALLHLHGAVDHVLDLLGLNWLARGRRIRRPNTRK